MAVTTKILIIGGTGLIGKFIVEASVKSGNPTFILVRESIIADPVKGKLIESFKNSGATLLYGDLYDHESLVKAIKQVDVVISAVGHGQIADQVKIISAIKEAGNVKRFFPSEFGNDVDRSRAVEPAKSAFEGKAKIRRAVEAAGIPYTYVSSNFFAGYFLPNLSQPGATAPPRDKVIILGDGNAKAVFNKEDDIGTYTIKAVNDPRTLNKILYIKPPANTLSFNDLVSLWEKKIGKTLEKVYLPEEQVLKNIQEAPLPINVVLSITHSVYVLGDQTYFEIEPSFGVEASELYPDVKYTTVDEYLDQFGELYDHESLVKAIKQVDVVISAVGHGQIADQVKIISAIKEAGNVKRFFPSEFGNDVDRSRAVEPAKSAFEGKAQIRRAVEAAGIPYTYVSSNFFSGYFLPSLSQPGATSPPRDEVIILGDGNAKDDIGTYTIKAVNDPRTLNKILYIKPPANTLSFNELVSLWEKKIGKTLEKVYLPEEQVLKNIQEAPHPINLLLSMTHSVYVLGDQTYFEIKPSFGVEASELYPDVKYTTVDEYLDQFV
ncbi:NmrA-like [Macleaya cordata]|uniref:NmrA-like n=1 Tax=Macleaya cordata TaxID=56857 RepID=A0A200Q9A0_MACCD|nr:NmrA-like [Macleaya cordata]